jgi:hypothetical protein
MQAPGETAADAKGGKVWGKFSEINGPFGGIQLRRKAMQASLSHN